MVSTAILIHLASCFETISMCFDQCLSPKTTSSWRFCISIFFYYLFLRIFFLNLEGLHKLSLLNLEGCPVTAACLDSLSGFYSVQVLGLSASQYVMSLIGIMLSISWYCLCETITGVGCHSGAFLLCVYNYVKYY